MAGRDPDPRYAARFQRGWTGDPETPAPVDPPAPADPEPEADTRPIDAPTSGIGFALTAGVFAILAAGALAWGCLDPAFTSPPHPDRLAAVRVIAEVAAGPLLAAVVVATALALRRAALRPALLVATGVAVGALVAVGVAATGISSLTALTAHGPVSSGGVPLADAAMAVYEQRVQTIGMLTAALPGLILAAALGVLLVVAVAARALVARPSA